MKRSIILGISLIFAAINLFAQIPIPNGGFDNWTSVGSSETPNFWSTLNGTTVSMGTTTCEKGNPGLYGNSYLKLTSKKNNSNTVVPGIAVCGTLNANTIQPTSGFPFSQRPVNLTGSWQYMYGSNSSKGYIDVKLTRWDSVQHQRVTVASLHHLLSSMVMNWQNFSFRLTYNDTTQPDTCIIVLAASNSTPMEYDYLYVDNLGFDGYVTAVKTGIEQQSNENYITIFPNPVSANEFTLSINKSSEGAQMTIYSVSGVLVKTEILKQNQLNIDVSDLNNGCYIIVVVNKDAIFKKMFVVERR